MNELISTIQWHILGLPISDPFKNYYNGFLERVRASSETDYVKLRKLQMLLKAIKARYNDLWLNSPLVIIFDTILESLREIGEGAITVAKVPLELLKPINLIIILSVIAVIGFMVFLIITKAKT